MRTDFGSLVMASGTLLDEQGQAIASMSRQGASPAIALADLVLEMNKVYDAQERRWASVKIEMTNLVPKLPA